MEVTYIALDTCVWAELLQYELLARNDFFEEILFYLEKGHLQCITTVNLNREWLRTKNEIKSQWTPKLSQYLNEQTHIVTRNPSLDPTDPKERINARLDERIDRIDRLLTVMAKIADREEDIIPEAARRSLNKAAPNHVKDSFRDTVNILNLIDYLKRNKYKSCLFVTCNKKDFSDPRQPHIVHSGLQADFANASLEYVFFELSRDNYAGLFKRKLKSLNLPSFVDYLKKKEAEEQTKKLDEKKSQYKEQNSTTDPEYLENIRVIDFILNEKSPTKAGKSILNLLFESHPAYREYFLNKVGNNGVV